VHDVFPFPLSPDRAHMWSAVYFSMKKECGITLYVD